ncbi:DUF3466 family protein [Vibrio sp. WXL103]|uniref:DUF3466 family protein n=1 Tax=Vibrio sp. WXL103 TaxID=3450710 RepID=UPI003EC60F6E
MSSKNFKLSVVTSALLSAFAVNAAPMYQVVPVEVPNDLVDSSFIESHGIAIQPSAEGDELGCFAPDADETQCSGYLLGGETRNTVDGISLKDEAPFGMDVSFGYIEERRDFRSYCYRELLYATCDESWSREYWSAWQDDLNGVQNLQSFVEGDDIVYDNTDFNNVITRLDIDGNPIGIQSTKAADSVSAPRREIVAVSPYDLSASLDGLEDEVEDYRAWATLTTDDGTVYIVGSSSVVRNNTNGNHFTSKATVWTSTDDGFDYTAIAWESGKGKDGERLAQGSMRDIAQVGEEIYAVGYNTWDSSENYLEASVFKLGEDGFENESGVSGARIENSKDERVNSNTQLVSLNQNGVAIGESKLRGSRPENGAAANRPFVVLDITDSPSAKYLQTYDQELFFSGMGADLGAINNYNEIVGEIDASRLRESDGQPRRRRGFIFTVPGLDSPREDLYRQKAWLLDDLTNDGEVDGFNNQYRIISASDINDAGVIAATAIFCEGGYDDTAHNAYCGNRQGEEKVVAVKLVPNQLSADDEIPTITPRELNDPPVERQGAGFGWLFLAALGVFGLRRR